MDGNILGVDVQNNQVALKTPSGERYYFPISEWKGDFEPQAGMKVDFDIKDGVATNVFPLTNAVNKHQFKAIGDKPTKTKTAATLWAFFLGGLGAHKFYLGAWGWGLLHLLFCWTYIPTIISIVETVRYVILTDAEFQEKYQKLDGAFDFLW